MDLCFLYINSLVGRQFLFNTNIKVAGIVVIWARAGGVVQGRGRIARLSGGRALAWVRGVWPGTRGGGGGVVAVIVPRVGGGRGVAVVGGLGHPPTLVKIVWPPWTPRAGVGGVVRAPEIRRASELRGRGAAVRPRTKVGREHVVRGRREVPGPHSIGWRTEKRPWRPVGVRGKWHSHVRGETSSASYKLHLVDSLLLAPLILKPNLNDTHG